MEVKDLIRSLEGTPYLLDQGADQQPAIERLLLKSSEILERYRDVQAKIGSLIRTDPEFRAWQTFHSNRLELQGPDLRTTRDFIDQFDHFPAGKEPDDLRAFSALRSVQGDSHLVEVLGQHQANLLVERIADHFSSDRPFSESDLRDLNAFCIQDRFFAGKYRETNRVNIGQHFDSDDPFWWSQPLDHGVEVDWTTIPDHMSLICAYISREHAVPPLASAVAHAWFTHVHPFHDGNGRTARLIANLVLIRNSWPPITINKGKRDEYLDALSESDSAGDIRLLFQLFVDSLDLNLQELEDTGFWRRRYQRELRQNQGHRHQEWVQAARDLVGEIRGMISGVGWSLEQVSMPDSDTYLLLEEGVGRAATFFGKLRHKDRREIRVGIGFMSNRLKQANTFDSTVDGRHYPPTLYMTERNYLPTADYPYLSRRESNLRVREFCLLPGGERNALLLYGSKEPTPMRVSATELARLITQDLDTVEFPGFRANKLSDNSTVLEGVATANLRRLGATSSGLLGLSYEASSAAISLREELELHPPETWSEVAKALLSLMDRGYCFQTSLSDSGVLLSEVGLVLATVPQEFPTLPARPAKTSQLFEEIFGLPESLREFPNLTMVASRHEPPHPTIVHRDRRFGRTVWESSKD